MSASGEHSGDDLPAPGRLVAATYRLRRLLGVGGMGAVYEARHELLGLDVALKLLLPKHARDGRLVARFLKEARTAALVTSPHVVRVFDVGVLESGAPYLVMEFLRGVDVAALLAERGRLRPGAAAALLLQAIEGVAAVHEAGIVHRDLKPSNLFLEAPAGRAPIVKVVDFGISKALGGAGETTSADSLLGSPAYMAPEQIAEPGRADTRADLWSLGVIAFQLVTGALPFDSPSIGGLLHSILQGTPRSARELVPDLPPGFDAVLRRCLQREPAARFADTRALRDALRPFDEGPAALAELGLPPAAAGAYDLHEWPPFEPKASSLSLETLPAVDETLPASRASALLAAKGPASVLPPSGNAADATSALPERAPASLRQHSGAGRRAWFAALPAALLVGAALLWRAAGSRPTPTRSAGASALAPSALVVSPAFDGPVGAWLPPREATSGDTFALRDRAGHLVVASHVAEAWQSVDASAEAGQALLAAPPTAWVSTGLKGGHHDCAAAADARGRLLVFERAAGSPWQATDITAQAGYSAEGPLARWQTPNGDLNIEHLAARSLDGDLVVYWRSSTHDWWSTNVSLKTGRRIASPVAPWKLWVNDAPPLVEHLAAIGTDGHLYDFVWRTSEDWRAYDITLRSGVAPAGPPEAWVTGNLEHLAAHDAGHALYVFDRSPGALDFVATNVSAQTGLRVEGRPSSLLTLAEGESVETLVARTPAGHLAYFWRTAAFGWQGLDLSELTGLEASGDPIAFAGAGGTPGLAFVDREGGLRVLPDVDAPRRLLDAARRPSAEGVRPVQGTRQLLTVLFDPQPAGLARAAPGEVRRRLFGPEDSARDYFRSASNDRLELAEAATVGWVGATRPSSHYHDEASPQDGDGFAQGHLDALAEALRAADDAFDFAAHDRDGDGEIAADELAVLVVALGRQAKSWVETPLGREVPAPEPLLLDGKRLRSAALVETDGSLALGPLVQSLGKLILRVPDSSWQAVGRAGSSGRVQLDAASRLRLGWLAPSPVSAPGSYTLGPSTAGGQALLLIDPQRGPDQYFLVENRYPGAAYEDELAGEGGLAVWFVDNAGQGRGAPRLVAPIAGQPFWTPANGLLVGPLLWGDGTPSPFVLRPLTGPGPRAGVAIESR
ncbi:MAG: serine/threonine protein kinase [Polyangiaceae bacterium]|nr:serine/threonine protein kinase [Polyangiaceae bacterium]